MKNKVFFRFEILLSLSLSDDITIQEYAIEAIAECLTHEDFHQIFLNVGGKFVMTAFIIYLHNRAKNLNLAYLQESHIKMSEVQYRIVSTSNFISLQQETVRNYGSPKILFFFRYFITLGSKIPRQWF